MKTFYSILVLAGCLCSGLLAQNLKPDEGQQFSNWRSVVFTEISDTLYLDSLTVIPSTVSVRNLSNGATVDESYYTVIDNYIFWNTRPTTSKGVEVSFRVFPYDLTAPSQRKDTAWISAKEYNDYIPYEYNPYERNPDILEFEGLNYAGSFARGISFGNNQDLVLNSSFNLQMAGDIGDEIEILAAISDNNIPLQPEGNTQQLQEFDQVFIQLKRRKSMLIAGDYRLDRPKGYFMNYFRKLQGLNIESQFNLGDSGTLDARLSGAVSKGQFARNTFNGEEGNQGPYKLTGTNGEVFIIVLAGTEKVFIDGALMIRGSANDYVIDYNTGEITFTTNRLITKDKRIVIEFSYSVNNYPRTLYGTNLFYNSANEKLNLYFNLFSEQDGKNQSAQQELTAFQQLQFTELGDEAASAFFSGVDTLEEFDLDRPMYKLIDSTVNNVFYDSVFVQTFSPDSARYTLQFSNVGLGNGNYMRLNTSANFRIYQWVAPDENGVPQGEFEPVVRLVPPQRNQLYTLGASYKLSKNSKLSTELALSNTDLNTFSDLDSDDNLGVGLKARYENKTALGKVKEASGNPFVLSTELDYEFTQSSFSALDPYRDVEFSRNWNTALTEKADEHLGKAGFLLSKKGFGKIQYELSSFIRGAAYTGVKHSGLINFSRKGYEILGQASYLTVEENQQKSRFFRPKLDISKTFNNGEGWKVGVYGEREKNEKFVGQSDTLQNNSFFYDLVKFYVNAPSSSKFKTNAFYSRRFDYEPVEDELDLSTIADEVNLEGSWLAGKTSQLKWNLTYRNLQIKDDATTEETAQETYLGRVEYLLNVGKGFLRANTIYQLGAGQEKRFEFTYLEVNPGEGVYTWIDRNGDGIKQLDEFEVAVFQDEADHVRVTTLTDEFIRSNSVQFNQSLGLNPVRIWRKETGIKLFLSKFSTQSTWQITRRTLDDDNVNPWNPFQLNISDTTLLSLTSNIRNALFFNRINPKYGFELAMLDNRNRIILTTGFENRERREQSLKFRWNPSKKVGTNLTGKTGVRENDSEFFNSKDYKIRFYQIEPSLTLLFNKNFRTILKYRFQDSQNEQGLEEQSVSHDISAELTYNKIAKSEIRARISFVDVDYQGDKGTPVEFAMLQGLQDGRNYLWNIIFERRVAKNVLMNISYEGRQTGSSKVIHVGRASIRATF